MFGRKKPLCLSCKTGKGLYELDSRSEMCHYIPCYNFIKNKCRYYKPLEADIKTLIGKISGILPHTKKK